MERLAYCWFMIRKCNVRMKKLNLHLLLIAFSSKENADLSLQRCYLIFYVSCLYCPVRKKKKKTKKIVSNSNSFYFVKQRRVQSECKLNKKLNKKSILHRRDTLPKSNVDSWFSQSECKWNKNWIKGNKHSSVSIFDATFLPSILPEIE